MGKEVVSILGEQTNCAINNIFIVLNDIKDLWFVKLDGIPLWRHTYHMIHSLDKWLINPEVYIEPIFHKKDLNNLDINYYGETIAFDEMIQYLKTVHIKINAYYEKLSDEDLLKYPLNCSWNRLTLIIGQLRHLNCHLGMLMAEAITNLAIWPEIKGLE